MRRASFPQDGYKILRTRSLIGPNEHRTPPLPILVNLTLHLKVRITLMGLVEHHKYQYLPKVLIPTTHPRLRFAVPPTQTVQA